MKKDLDWAISEIEQRIENVEEHEKTTAYNKGVARGLGNSLFLINQLDEPDKGLLEPKKENTEGHGMSESEWAEDIARYKRHLEQEGYIVIEKPTIPGFVAEYLDERKETPIYRLVDSNFIYDIDDDLARWLYNNDNRTNKEREIILVLAHIYGYEAEEDPKYIIDTDDIEISDGNHYLINLTLSKDSVELPIVGDKSDAVQFDDINQAQAIASYVGGRVEVLEE